MHSEWAAPIITVTQPPPSIYSHGERQKHCTLLMYMSLLPRVSRKTKQLNWLMDEDVLMRYHKNTGLERDSYIELLSPWGNYVCTPYHSPTICLFRADNHILSQKYIALFLPCLAASAKH